MLNRVADGVWVRQSEWVWTNSIVVRGNEAMVVDPGIHGAELEELAEDVERLGEVPRYATAACAQVASEKREQARKGRRRKPKASRWTRST